MKQNTQNGTYISIKGIKRFGKCWPCPVFESYYPGTFLTTKEKARINLS
jgi:hypothetical protein